MLNYDFFIRTLFRNRRIIRLIFQRNLQNSFIASPQNRQHTMAGHRTNPFTMVKIILKLFSCCLLSSQHLRLHFPFTPQLFTQHANQFRIFRKLLHQNSACPLQSRLHIRHLLIHIMTRHLFRRFNRRTKQSICQWL